MKKIITSEKGSVSVYLIIIFTAIFFLNAVLIDYARIMAAKKETENALKSSLRSVLSAYSYELYNDYGLFGITNNEEEIFTETFMQNTKTEDGGFNLVNPSLDNSSISLQYDHQLANHSVFEQQILEEMKYQAPIEITEDIIDKFSFYSQSMKDASTTTNTLTDINDLYEERQKLLKDATEKQKESSEIYEELGSFRDYEGVINGYNGYIEDLRYYKMVQNSTMENKAQILSDLQEEIDKYVKSSREINKVYSDLNSSSHQDKLDKAKEKLLKAKSINEEIKVIVEEAQRTSVSEEYKEIIESLDQVVIEDDFFIKFENDLNRQKDLYDITFNNLSYLKIDVNREIGISIYNIPSTSEQSRIGSRMRRYFNNVIMGMDEYDRYYLDRNNTISSREKTLQKMEKDQKTKENEENSKNNLETVNKFFDALEQVKGEREDLKTVDKYYHEYNDFNSISSEILAEADLNKDPDDVTADSMSMLTGMMSKITNFMLDARNEIYVNEYAYLRFNNFDPNLLGGAIKTTSSTGSNNSSSTGEEEKKVYQSIEITDDNILGILALENQELEYIIYGHTMPGGNLARAISEIFLIRLGVRTAEGLVKFKGPPLSVLAASVSYGVAMAIKDIVSLLNGQEVKTFTKFLSLDYKDHIRFLLLIHNNHTDKLSRMQAVIHFNTNRDLKETPTYLVADVKTSIDLWFIPGIMKGLNTTGILDGNVNGKKYIISKRAVMAY